MGTSAAVWVRGVRLRGMCGRYAQTRADDELARRLSVDAIVGEPLGPSWNVAPTQGVRVVLEHAGDDGVTRELRTARWGLVPGWAKDPSIGSRMINARSETVTVKPAYRKAAARRRALQPADGYYEWQAAEHGPKTPYFLHGVEPGEPLLFAALYEWWRDPTMAEDDPARWLLSSTILTHPATDELGRIHDRTPVIIPPALVDTWLDPAFVDPAGVLDFLAGLPEPHLVPREVSRRVNSVRNDGPDLVEAVGE